VENIASTSIVKDAWTKGNPISVHGWLYNLETGKLTDLDVDVEPSWATNKDE
jgi:carbonic anhydrase